MLDQKEKRIYKICTRVRVRDLSCGCFRGALSFLDLGLVSKLETARKQDKDARCVLLEQSDRPDPTDQSGHYSHQG